MLGAGLGVLRHDDDAIGAEVVALEGGELAAACPGEEREADQAAVAAEAGGGLP